TLAISKSRPRRGAGLPCCAWLALPRSGPGHAPMSPSAWSWTAPRRFPLSTPAGLVSPPSSRSRPSWSCASAAPAPALPTTPPVHGGEEDVRECFRRLSSGRHACPPGHPAERSATAPAWLLLPDSSACGCLEDTRRAKRLVTDDGQEMVSAHLSCFAWRDLRAGAMLFRAALARAAALGFPALFVAVPRRDADALEGALKDVEVIRAPATVYAYGLPGDTDWNINSSEI